MWGSLCFSDELRGAVAPRASRRRRCTTGTSVVRAAYHPDFHRRSRSFTRSTGRWLRSGRGLSPPVRSCTDPGARADEVCRTPPCRVPSGLLRVSLTCCCTAHVRKTPWTGPGRRCCTAGVLPDPRPLPRTPALVAVALARARVDVHRRPLHGPEHTVHATVERGVGSRCGWPTGNATGRRDAQPGGLVRVRSRQQGIRGLLGSRGSCPSRSMRTASSCTAPSEPAMTRCGRTTSGWRCSTPSSSRIGVPRHPGLARARMSRCRPRWSCTASTRRCGTGADVVGGGVTAGGVQTPVLVLPAPLRPGQRGSRPGRWWPDDALPTGRPRVCDRLPGRARCRDRSLHARGDTSTATMPAAASRSTSAVSSPPATDPLSRSPDHARQRCQATSAVVGRARPVPALSLSFPGVAAGPHGGDVPDRRTTGQTTGTSTPSRRPPGFVCPSVEAPTTAERIVHPASLPWPRLAPATGFRAAGQSSTTRPIAASSPAAPSASTRRPRTRVSDGSNP